MPENRETQLNNNEPQIEPQEPVETLSTETETEKLEQKTEYNFEFMAEIEPAMVSLVEQLKDKIDSGEYDALLSDDIGGRIPTLILRKIMREKGPKKDIQTNFLASGQIYLPRKSEQQKYEKMLEYLKKLNLEDKRLLVVSEYIFHGKTLNRIADALSDSGVATGFDFAVLWTSGLSSEDISTRPFYGKYYIGAEKYKPDFEEKHESIGGVRKTKEYRPYPERVIDNMVKHGREISPKELNEIFEISNKDATWDMKKKFDDPEKLKKYNKRIEEPLTESERKEIEGKIQKARKDVDLVAERVMAQVWGNDEIASSPAGSSQ